MFRKLGLVCAALAFFSIAGGHWTVLQSVAWVGMLHDYSQQGGSLVVAVEQTFDGQHPCELCQQIQVGKAKERKESPTAPGTKDDAKVKALLANPVVPALARTTGEISFSRAVLAPVCSRSEQPPTPPPRRGTLAA